MSSAAATINLQHLFSDLTSESRALKNTRLLTKRLLTSGEHGNFRTAFRGQGLQLKNLREYAPGDDVRHIHWAASARSQRVQLKNFEDERTLRVIVLLDISPSALCDEQFIRRYIEFFSLICALCDINMDLVGFGFFAPELLELAPPAAPKSALQKFRAALAALPVRESTDLKRTLADLVRRERTRALIIIVSDFACEDFSAELKSLAAAHDVVGILRERPKLPESGLVWVQDAEDKSLRVLDCSDSAVKADYERAWNEHRDALLRTFRGVGAKLIQFSTPIQTVRDLARRQR
jgi:uncharacterized protein (DUF58 family)